MKCIKSHPVCMRYICASVMKRYFSAVGNQDSASADQIQVLASALVGAKGAD